MKKAQKIRGTNFPEKAIPDTFQEFKKLYENYPMYKDLKNKESEMSKDFAKLTGKKAKKSNDSIQQTVPEV